MVWNAEGEEPSCEHHCSAPRHQLEMTELEKLPDHTQTRPLAPRVLKCSRHLVLFVLLALLVLRGSSALDAADSGGSLTIGPSQVLLPWLPASPPSPFPAVRAEVRVEGETSGDKACLFWSQQSTSVVSLLRPDCPVTSPAEACALSSFGINFTAASDSSGPSRKRQCFSKVLVEAAPQQSPLRQRSWIFASLSRGGSSATEGSGGHRYPSNTFRLQALVAPIARLELYTRDKRLAIGQIADVGVLAFDSEGNAFTTLEGVPFVWRVDAPGIASASHAVVELEHVQADAAAATPTRRRVEEVGLSVSRSAGEQPLRADSLVVRGRAPGVATLTARLASPEYAHVPAAQVQLTVADVIALLPSDLRVPPASVLSYKLIRLLDGGGSELVALPAAPFSWAVRDVSVISHSSGETVFSDAGGAEAPVSTQSLLAAVTQRGSVYVQGVRDDGQVYCGELHVDVWDTRISDRQSTRLFVSVPEALRLGFQDVTLLSTKGPWKKAVAAAREAARGAAKAERDLTLRFLASQEEGRLFGATAAFARELSFVFPADQTSVSSFASVATLVEGEEYVFALDALAATGVPIFVPENALVHWESRAEEGEGEGEDKEEEASAGSPLEKAAAAPRGWAWFRAVSPGSGRVVATLLHVGTSSDEEGGEGVEGFWRPSPALEAALLFRVQRRVGLRYFGEDGEAKTPQGGRRLVSPLLLPLNGSLDLHPTGGSGRFNLTSLHVDVASVEAAASGSEAFDSETGDNADGRVFVVKAKGVPGVALLTLRDSLQPRNSLQIYVVVCEPREVRLLAEAVALPVRESLPPNHALREGLPLTAVASARLPSDLSLLPEDSREWLSKGRLHGDDQREKAQGIQWGRRHSLQFAACSGLAVEVEAEIEILSEEPPPPFACRRLRVAGKREGRSAVKFFFPFFPSVEAVLRIDVFGPLEALVVVDGALFPLPSAMRGEEVRAAFEAAGLQRRRRTTTEGKTASAAPSVRRPSIDVTATDGQGLLRSVRINDRLRMAAPAQALAALAECAGESGFLSSVASERASSNLDCATGSSLALAVGTESLVVLRGGPPSVRSGEAYRHFLEWKVESGSSKTDEASMQSVAVLVGTTSGASQREASLVCLAETQGPVRVVVEASLRPLEDSNLGTAFEDSTEFLVECQLPQHLELFPLPSLSAPWSERSGSVTKMLDSMSESFVDPRRERRFRVSEEAALSGEDGFSLAVECGSLHAFALTAFDQNMRPLLGAFSLSPAWSVAFEAGGSQKEGAATEGTSDLRVEVFSLRRDAPPEAGGDLAVLFLPPSLCCGRVKLAASIRAPSGLPESRLSALASKGALSSQQRVFFEKGAAEWRKAAREKRLLFWTGEELRVSLTFLSSPPLRLMPSPLASTKARGGVEDIPRLRLFAHPGVAYRLLLQFGSAQHLAVRLASSPAEATAAAADGAEGGSLLLAEFPPSERRLASLLDAASSGSSSLSSILSPAALPQKRFEAAVRGGPNADQAQRLRAVDLAVSRGASAMALLPPMRFPFDPLASDCPVAVREVWIRGGLLQKPQRQSSRLRLEAVDAGLLEATPRRRPSSEQGLGLSTSAENDAAAFARLEAEVEFLSLKSLHLTLSEEPLALSAASGLAQEGAVACASVRWPSSNSPANGEALSVQAGGVYALRVVATAQDGVPFDAAFFPAMKLSLSAETLSGETPSRPLIFVGRRRLPGEGENRMHRAAAAAAAEASGEGASASVSFDGLLPSWLERHALFQRAEDALSLGLSLASGEKNKRERNARGAACGDFFFAAFSEGIVRLTVEAENPFGSGDAPRVFANLTLQVHAPLELVPRRLLLLPGGHSLELASRGGRPNLLKLSKENSGLLEGRESVVGSLSFSSSQAAVAAFGANSGADAEEGPSSLLVTGEEGDSEVKVVWKDSFGRAVAQAEAFVRVALPESVEIRLPSNAIPFFSPHSSQELSLPSLAFDAMADSTAPSDNSANRPQQLYVHSTLPLRAVLKDVHDAEFFAPSLSFPVGSLSAEEDDSQSHAVEQFGAAGAALPSTAVVCRFSWSVNAEKESPALLMDVRESHDVAYEGVVFEARNSSLRERASRVMEGEGLAEVALLGVTPGTLTLAVEVSCFREDALVAGPLRAEVSLFQSTPKKFNPTYARELEAQSVPLSFRFCLEMNFSLQKSVAVLPDALEEFRFGGFRQPLLLAAFGEYPMLTTFFHLKSVSPKAASSSPGGEEAASSPVEKEKGKHLLFNKEEFGDKALSLLPESRGVAAGAERGGGLVEVFPKNFENNSSPLRDDAAASRVVWMDVVEVEVLELQNVPSLLALEETAKTRVVLKSATGVEVAPPFNLTVEVFSSHASVLAAHVEYATEAGIGGSSPRVVLKGIRKGCAALLVLAVFSRDDDAPSRAPFVTRRICVDSNFAPHKSLLPHTLPSGSAVALLPGARAPLKDFVDGGPKGRSRLRLRLHFKAAALLSALTASSRNLSELLEASKAPVSRQAAEAAISWATFLSSKNGGGAWQLRCLSREAASQLLRLFSPQIGQALREAAARAFALPPRDDRPYAFEEDLPDGAVLEEPSVWVGEPELAPSPQRDDSAIFARDTRCLEGRSGAASDLAFVDIEFAGRISGLMGALMVASPWRSQQTLSSILAMRPFPATKTTLSRRVDGVEKFVQNFWNFLAASFSQALREASEALLEARDAAGGGLSGKPCEERRTVRIGAFPFLTAFIDWGAGLQASIETSGFRSERGQGLCRSGAASSGRALLTSSNSERLSLSGGCREAQIAVSGKVSGNASLGYRRGRKSSVASFQTLAAEDGSASSSARRGSSIRVLAAASCVSSLFKIGSQEDVTDSANEESATSSLALEWTSLNSAIVEDCALGLAEGGGALGRFASASALLFRVQSGGGEKKSLVWTDLHSGPFFASSLTMDCRIASPLWNLLFEARLQQMPLSGENLAPSRLVHACILMRRPPLNAELDLSKIRQAINAMRELQKEGARPLRALGLTPAPPGFFEESLENELCREAIRSLTNFNAGASVVPLTISASLRPAPQIPQLAQPSQDAVPAWLVGCAPWRVRVSMQLLFDARFMAAPGVVRAPPAKVLTFSLKGGKFATSGGSRVFAVGPVFAEVFLFPVSENAKLMVSVSSDAYAVSVSQEGALATVILRTATFAIPSTLADAGFEGGEERPSPSSLGKNNKAFDASWKPPPSAFVRVSDSSLQQTVTFAVEPRVEAGGEGSSPDSRAASDFFSPQEEEGFHAALRVIFVGCLVLLAAVAVWFFRALPSRGRGAASLLRSAKEDSASLRPNQVAASRLSPERKDGEDWASRLRRLCAGRPSPPSASGAGRSCWTADGGLPASYRLKEDGDWIWERAVEGPWIGARTNGNSNAVAGGQAVGDEASAGMRRRGKVAHLYDS